MLLDITTKADKDGPHEEEEEEKALSSLVSSLDDLSIHETSKKEISILEEGISYITLGDSGNIKQSQEETAENEEVTIVTEPAVSGNEESESAEQDGHSPSTKSDESETEEETDLEKVEVKENYLEEKENDQLVERKKEEKDVVTQEETNESDIAPEEKSGEEEEEEEDAENEADEKKEEESESENGAADATTTPVAKEKKGRKLLSRGLVSGCQSDQYEYPMHQSANTNYQNPEQAFAPFTDPQQMGQGMSPQQAMSPAYPNTNMSLSPLPGYTDCNVYSPMQNGDIGFSMDGSASIFITPPSSTQGMSPQQDMSPAYPNTNMSLSPLPGYTDYNVYSPMQNGDIGYCMDGSASTFMTPPSSTQDESEISQQFSPGSELEGPASPDVITSQSTYSHSLTEVLEAITNVLNSPHNTVDRETLEETRRNLLENLPTFDSDTDEPSEDELADRRAEREIKRLIDGAQYEKAKWRMKSITDEMLTEKDKEGDNPCVIVACQNENSERFYENLVSMVERGTNISICCEKPINARVERCAICGNSDRCTFYSPFSMVNDQGDNLLSSIIKAGQSQLVVTYICENIYKNQADVNRIFSGQNVEFYRYFQAVYPVLERLLPNY